MEQTQECLNPSRKISDEVLRVYEIIAEYRRSAKANEDNDRHNKTESLMIRTTFAVLAIIGLLMAALYFLPPTTWGDSNEAIRLTVQAMILAAYALGGGAILVQFLSVKSLYKDFTGQILDIVTDEAKVEANLFVELDSMSTQSIQYVANRFEQTSTQLGTIRSFLLGAIDKVGIIPGLLATVLAISNVADSTGISWLELLSLAMLGIYLSMFPIATATIKIKRYSILLNQYLELFREIDDRKNLRQ